MKYTEKAQETVNALLARFQAGDIAPIVEVATVKLTPEEKSNTYPAQRWSFQNQVLALIQTGELDCRGFNQWQETKRNVKKGSKAAYILGPIIVKEKDEKTGKESTALVGFKSIPVFALSDTEGEELPEYKTPERPLPMLADVAKAWGLKITWGEAKGYFGYYAPGRKEIHLATEEQKVFFHELAHAAHDKLQKGLKGGQDAEQETIADFTACVLMQIYGLKDMTGNTWEYIKRYNPKDPIKAILKCLDTIGKVLDLILTTAHELETA